MRSSDVHDSLVKRVQALVPTVVNAALKANSADVISRLDAVDRRLRATELTLVVMGEFSRGKSSLLNALLADPDLFPVDSYVSTRVLTSAGWGPEETVTVALAAQGDLPAERRQIGRADLRGYICEADVEDGVGAADAERVASVSIATPNPKLRDGLVVVDTPGIGGVHRGHTAVALGVLRQADAVVFVTDALQPLLPSELAFVDAVAKAVDADRHPERLLFVVTKADQVKDAAVVVRDLLAQVAAAGVAPRSAAVAVSSRHRLLHLTGGDPEDQELSNFDELEARLWPSVRQARLELGLGAALPELDVAVQSLLDPVERALAVLDAQDAGARDELAASARDRRSEAAKLTDGAAEWTGDLRASLAAAAASLQTRAAADLAAVWRSLRVAYRSNPAYADDPQLALDELAGRLAALVGEIDTAVAAQTASVCEAVAARSGLRLRGPALAALPTPALPVSAETAAMVLPGRPAVAEVLGVAFDAAARGAQVGAEMGSQIGQVAWDFAVREATRKALPGGSGALVPKAVVDRVVDSVTPSASPGAVVGAITGGVVGATLTFASELRSTLGVSRAERVAAFDRLFEPWEEQQRVFLQGAITDVVNAYSTAATADLRSRIDQRRAECDAAASEVTAALEAVGRDSDGTRQALAARREFLLDVRRVVAELANELRSLLPQP